jgi:hypothetical protein
MTDDAKPSLLVYSGLYDDEQARLEVNENTVATLLVSELGVRADARWVGVGEGSSRVIRLLAPNHNPETIFEISAMDLAERSHAELLEEITHVIRQV